MNRPINVFCVFGTRPEAIKLAPLILALKNDERFACTVCATMQHRELTQQILPFFDIVPDMTFDMMVPRQGLDYITTEVLSRLTPILSNRQPDCVIVQGDTTTAFAAALAAFYNRISVGHVEAGLRTGDLDAPWPEEANRRFIDVMARWRWAPTITARDNLLREGLPRSTIRVTGNTVIDATRHVIHRLDSDPELDRVLRSDFAFLDPSRRLVLVTGHRRESIGPRMRGTLDGLAILSRRKDVQIVYVLHPNPEVREAVSERLKGTDVVVIEPLGYAAFLYLMRLVCFLISDSGGVQEEAAILGKPVLVTREKTERTDEMAAGFVSIIGFDTNTLVDAANALLDGKADPFRTSDGGIDPGKSSPCAMIVEDLAMSFADRSQQSTAEGLSPPS